MIQRTEQSILQVTGLKKYFPVQKGILRKTVGYIKAIDGIDFNVDEGETVGLVGESGSGKTTTGRSIIRLHPVTEGEILFRIDGQIRGQNWHTYLQFLKKPGKYAKELYLSF